MTKILGKRKTFIRCPLDELGENIVFYDIETDHQYAPYATIKSIAAQYGFRGRPRMVTTRKSRRRLRKKLADPSCIKVQFNGINFDDIVLERSGYHVHPQNRHDVFLMFKTIAPGLPAFSQKFIAFYYLRDPHFPEQRLHAWCNRKGKDMHEAPRRLLYEYNAHDVKQLVDLFRLSWDIIIRDEHWDAYMEDNMMGEPLLEMETEGGIILDHAGCWKNLHALQKEVLKQQALARELTEGVVNNANSSKQLAHWFTHFDNLELELTAAGEFSVKKSVLVSLRDSNPVADCAFRIREANGTLKYFENYLKALDDPTYADRYEGSWIPVQFSVSSARTRRFTSQSLYKLNFQNPNGAAKSVQLCPEGFIDFSFDATQIENIVHIYESEDDARRIAYEADPDWNEYVWLCNEILGTNKSKEELDDKVHSRSPRIPGWTLYKEYKTGKLAINFGMGVAKFCALFGLDRDVGEVIFQDVHRACPAIKELQRRVAFDVKSDGFVTDVFGKRYTGSVHSAYKVVAYLIQGCGTGSLPKAQIRANWETLRRFDKYMPRSLRSHKCGVMCQTTHDSNGGRIDLRMGDERILQLLQKMNYNMTEKFSHKFDNIPLRSKLYLTKTNLDNVIEVPLNKPKAILQIINGSPCPCCGASGRIWDEDTKKKEKCQPCRGWGYI